MALYAKQKKTKQPPAGRDPLLLLGCPQSCPLGLEERKPLRLQKQKSAVCAAPGLAQDCEGVSCGPGLMEKTSGEGCSAASTGRGKGLFMSREPT